MPTFDFDIGGLRNFENFKSFVNRLFFFPNQVRFERFSLRDHSLNNISVSLYGWLCAILWRGVKEIDIAIGVALDFPTFLFTCESLVTLKLEGVAVVELPSKVWLPNLKTLHLVVVSFDDDGSLHRLILGCPALEDFVLELIEPPRVLRIHSLSLKRLVLSFKHMVDCCDEFDHVVEIIAPNLVIFKYVGVIAEGYTVSGMKSLEKAHIRLKEFEPAATYNSETERGATHLLQAICNVKYLKLAIGDAEKLFGNRLESVLVFSNLVELEYKSFDEEEDVTWLVKFLHCVPILNKLTMIGKGGFGSRPNRVPSCLTCHLKEMEICDFSETESMFEMIGYFLDHASVLEKFTIRVDCPGKQSIIEEILDLPKTSEKCKVINTSCK